MAAICLDAGTSLIKAVAFDEAGHELALARRETEVRRPQPGFSEQDMEAVWQAACESLREVRAKVTEPIRFLSLTAQGDGLWLVDAHGRPTGPAILWNDARAASLVEHWRAEGRLAEGWRRNGSQTFPGLPNGLLRWLREHEPARLAGARSALTCNGWLFHQLTGRTAIDESDAAVPFMDIRTRRYAPELLHLYDLEWAEPLLPPILREGERVAALSSEAAGRLGLPPGLPVVMSPYDVAATAIGLGAVEEGATCSILGTTLCTEVVVRELDLAGTASGLTIPFGAELYLRAFPTLAGSEVIHWFLRQWQLENPAAFHALAAEACAGAGGLLFLPYLSPAGERVPFLDTAARGSWHGLSLAHGRAEMARSILEGLAYVISDCLNAAGAGAGELRQCGLSGGGAQSDLWCQTIADVTGVPAFRPIGNEVGAKGALLVGLVATGVESSLAAAARGRVQTRDRFAPDPARQAPYREGFAHFTAAREASRPLWARMAQANAAPAR